MNISLAIETPDDSTLEPATAPQLSGSQTLRRDSFSVNAQIVIIFTHYLVKMENYDLYLYSGIYYTSN